MSMKPLFLLKRAPLADRSNTSSEAQGSGCHDRPGAEGFGEVEGQQAEGHFFFVLHFFCCGLFGLWPFDLYSGVISLGGFYCDPFVLFAFFFVFALRFCVFC